MAANPFPTQSNPLTRQALELRGGWTPDAKDVAKLGLAVGATTALSTKTVLEKIGKGNLDSMSVLTVRRIGGSILNYSVAAYLMLSQNASATTAIGVGATILIIELAKTLFDGTHKELGIPAEGQAMVLFTTAIFSHLLINDSGGDNLMKIYSGFTIANGLLMGIFTKLALKLYGDKVDATKDLECIVSLWGFAVLSWGTLVALLDNGMATEKALGLGVLPFLLRLAVIKFAWLEIDVISIEKRATLNRSVRTL